MKKTLVAIAVLAATGAAFAQVTITGKLGIGIGKSASQTQANANTNNGLQTFDGDITFSATEDLGGGMKVIASTAVQLRGRNDDAAAATINGSQFRTRDSSIALITNMGVIALGSVESPSGFFRGPSYKDFLGTGFDNANGPWDGKANIDFIRYMVPVGKFQLSAWYAEVGSGAGNSTVLGVSTKVNAPIVMVNYADGPLTAYADYTAFSAIKTPGAPVGAVLSGNNRARIGGDYNFGVARVAVGYQMRDVLADQYYFGLVVPVGPLTVNLSYGARAATKANAGLGVAADGERTGTALQVQYNLSKQTLIETSYETYTGGGKIANGENDLSNGYRITLRKSF
jgi:predicted porin